MLEIGLNAGHSAETFFHACDELEKFVSFDLGEHPYAYLAAQYFQSTQGSVFSFIPGNSLVTVPQFSKAHPQETFDLIYIDGGHSYEVCYQDIRNCQKLANKDTILWIDDYWASNPNDGPASATNACVKEGIIEITRVNVSHDPIGGPRAWAEARYLF